MPRTRGVRPRTLYIEETTLRPSTILPTLATLGLLVAGCSAPASVGTGATGGREAGASDGGTTDGRTSDGRTSDGRTSDGGTSDGGTSDAGAALPVEVIGLGPVSRDLAIDVPAAVLAGAGAIGLQLTVHNIRYVGEGAVSVNGGADIPFAGKLLRAWGGTGTDLLPLPAGTLVAGKNTLTFKFLSQQEIVTGFRVVAVAIVTTDANGAASTYTPDLKLDDPTLWPVLDPTAVDAGSVLYHQRPESADGGVDGACADCHTASGADLQYFAYSNESLRVRSKFHHFSDTEATAIASYVRSANAAIAPVGRPWNPPFQPGPGNTGGAGAGLSAVLPDDATFTNQVFDGGVGPTHTYQWAGTLDFFKVPLPFELPDWHSWLPRKFDPTWVDFRPDLWAKFQASPTPDNLYQIEAAFHGAETTGGAFPFPASDIADHAALWSFVSVREWDWMHQNGFDHVDEKGNPDHGMLVDPQYPTYQPSAFWKVGAAYRVNSNFGPNYPMDFKTAIQLEEQWFWVQMAINTGRSMAPENLPDDYSYLASDLNSDMLEPFPGTPHLGALGYLRGVYEWHTSPAIGNTHLDGRRGALPGSVDAQLLSGPEVSQLLMQEMEADRTFFTAGADPILNNFFTYWNRGWSYQVGQGTHLSLDEQVALHDYINKTFPNAVTMCPGTTGCIALDPSVGLLPIGCTTSADCPSEYPTCEPHVNGARGVCH